MNPRTVAILALVISMVALLIPAARGADVRGEVWPEGEWYARQGEATDVLLPGAGVTLSAQGSNPGGGSTLFEGGTGWMFYGGDGRTDQLPARWTHVVTLAGDSGDGAADFTSWTLALASAEATTPSLIQLVDPVYTLPGQVVLPDGVSLHGAGRTLTVITCPPGGWYTAPDARTSALVTKWGDGEVAHLTIQNARTGYPSVALASGYNGIGSTSGDSIWIEDVVLISGSSDTLYFSGGNRIEAVNIEVTCANVDTMTMNPSNASAVYILRNSRVETQGVRGNAIYMATAGTFYSYGNEYWNANGGDSGAFWFVTSGGGTIWSVGDTFYDGAGASKDIGHVINGVGSGSGWTLVVDGTYSDLNDPELPNLTVAAGKVIGGNLIVRGDAGVDGDLDVVGDFTINPGTGDVFSVVSPSPGVVFGNTTAGGAIRYDLAGGKLEFDTTGDAWPVNLYLEDAFTLKTDDTFNASSLEIGGVGVINVAREIEATTMTLTGRADVNALWIDGVEVIPSSRVIPTANVTMDADPITTLGIATKGYVDQRIPTFQTLYLEGGASDVGGYLVMSPAIPSLPEDDVTVAGLVNDQIIEEWIGPPGGLGTPTIPSGSYSFEFHAVKTAGIQTLQAYVCLFLRTTLGVETLLGTTEISTEWDATEEHYNLHMSLEEQILDGPEDRIVGKVYAVVTGTGTAPTGVIYFQGTTDSKLVVPVTSGAYAQLTQPNEFTATNIYKKNMLVNEGLGENNTEIYGTSATPIAYFKALTNALGIGTKFPATGYALTVNGKTRVTGLVDVNGEAGDPALWVTTPDGGIPSILEAEKNTTGSIATGLYVRGTFPDHAPTNRIRAVWAQFDNGGQTNGLYSIARIETVSPFGSGGELWNYQAGSPAAFLDWDETGAVLTLKTQWRYFDAVSCGNGEVFPLGGGGAIAWDPNALTNAAYMKSTLDGISMVFPVPYESGTILKRLSARWQGVGAGDGVIVTLQERQGGTPGAAWATVGAAQTWTGTTETNSIYDFADKTMLTDYEYRIQVEAQRVTTESRLWEIGVETGARAL